MPSAGPSGSADPEMFRGSRYVVVGHLGQGAQGETLQAVDKQRGCQVAVKRFRIRGARSWKDVELAEREARVLAGLDHPALPRYVDHFEESGCLFLVTELIEGTPLSELRRRGVAMSEADVVRLLDECRGLLGYLHHRAPPIIHRDIKPGNVIRRHDGSFALVDFGSARDSVKSEGGSTTAGTFGYMAPEQLQGRALPGTDIYSLGVTAVSLLTGRDPEDLPHQGLRIDVRQALGSHFSPGLVYALSCMLEPDPDRRVAQVPTVGYAPGPAWGYPPPPPHPPWPPPAPRAAWEGSQWHRGYGWQGPAWGRTAPRRSSVRRPQPLPVPFLVAVVVLGLLVARLVTFATARVAVPVVLVLLSLLFGSRLRRAASSVRRAGREANGSLKDFSRWVRGRPTEPSGAGTEPWAQAGAGSQLARHRVVEQAGSNDSWAQPGATPPAADHSVAEQGPEDAAGSEHEGARPPEPAAPILRGEWPRRS